MQDTAPKENHLRESRKGLKDEAQKPASCEQPFFDTGKDEEQEQKEKGKSSEKVKPELYQVIDRYKELFTEATGQEPHIKRGQDHKLLKDIITSRGIKGALELLDIYFKEADSFTRDKQGYSIGFFAKSINRLITLKTNGGGKSEPLAWDPIREWLHEGQETNQAPEPERRPVKAQGKGQIIEITPEPERVPATDEEALRARVKIRAKLEGKPILELVNQEGVMVNNG